MNPTQRDDLWDRLTDLAEAVGGKQPQDKPQIGNIVPASRAASSTRSHGRQGEASRVGQAHRLDAAKDAPAPISGAGAHSHVPTRRADA